MSYFEIKKITFGYDRRQKPVIDHFSLAVERGEIVGISGPSGSGKSTLLRLITGLEVPQGGQIIIDGKPVFSENTCVPPEKRGVGMVFQDYALFPHLTVVQNILFGLHRIPKKKRQQRAKEVLELVQLQSFKDRYPYELSGGQQQRVALARALAPEPSMLVMDEPFSNLDADLKIKIRQELKQILKTAAMTCIFVTHDKEDVEAICDRAVYLT